MLSLDKPIVAAHQAFKVLAVVTAVTGAISLISGGRSVPAARLRVAGLDAGPKDAQSFSYYSSVILKHDLFKLAPPPVIAKAMKPPPPPKPTLAQLASDLSLVGILNNGEQAAILSKKSNETLYLSVGQQIAGITVSAIAADRVKLAYDGQSMDLQE